MKALLKTLVFSLLLLSRLMLSFKQKNQLRLSLAKGEDVTAEENSFPPSGDHPFLLFHPCVFVQSLNSSHVIPPSPGHSLRLLSSLSWQTALCFLLAMLWQELTSPVLLHSAAFRAAGPKQGCLNLHRQQPRSVRTVLSLTFQENQ